MGVHVIGRTLTSEIMNNDLDTVRKVNKACKKEQDAGRQIITTGKRIIEYVEVRPERKLPISVTKFNSQDIQDLIKLGEQDARTQLAKGWLTGTD